jgi:hypothetical protein
MLRLWAGYGIVILGKGDEGQGTETKPAKLELNPAIGSSHQKESNHGREEEKEEDEEDVMRAGLDRGHVVNVFGPTKRLERCFVTAAGPTSGRCCFGH